MVFEDIDLMSHPVSVMLSLLTERTFHLGFIVAQTTLSLALGGVQVTW